MEGSIDRPSRGSEMPLRALWRKARGGPTAVAGDTSRLH